MKMKTTTNIAKTKYDTKAIRLNGRIVFEGGKTKRRPNADVSYLQCE